MLVDLSKLNPEQRLAAETVRGPVLILAGAGTGKTRVITFRIAHMLDRGIPPESIAALTFTNKAAREMADRLSDLVGDKRAKRVWLGTFHSFCLAQLKLFPEKAGLAKGFTLAGTGDQLDLVRRAIKEDSTLAGLNIEAIHAAIGVSKNKLETAQDALAAARNSGDATRLLIAQAYELYERQLKLNRMIDFDDCIFKFVLMLEQDAEMREKLAGVYQYLMVDEFQDTNNAQLRILEMLGTQHNNVCVVGDDDQSIYSWRGAMYETLERFEQIFPNTKLVKLEQNYRCTDLILKSANAVIRNNTQRKDKSLWSTKQTVHPIQLIGQENETEEARWIALKCMSLIGEGRKPSEIAILYRANNLSKILEMSLREYGLKFDIYGGSSFFERKEVRDFIGYLRLVLNPDDRLAFWRVINTPHRGLGIKTLEKIEHLAKQIHKSPFYAASHHTKDLDLSGRADGSLEHFLDKISDMQALSSIAKVPDDLLALGDAIIKTFGLLEDARANAPDAATSERRVENIKSLPMWLKRCGEDQIRDKGELNLKDLLDKLTLNDRDISDRDDDKKRQTISLMTVHASKGLEFPFIFICGLEEDIFPHKNSYGSVQGLSEERRLFYVALTRAKERVFMTYCAERGNGAFKSGRNASRFIKEIPPEFVEREASRGPIGSVDDRKQATLGSLSKLRMSLQGTSKSP